MTGNNPIPEEVPRLDNKEALHTLGIYIFPSGSLARQQKILHTHAEKYFTAVSQSTLQPDEAFWSYNLFLWPQLTYPLPCTSFTERQCRTIQAHALASLLPKLHLNCHTPHTVLFGEAKFGGLELLD
jgi:hypothetical protein